MMWLATNPEPPVTRTALIAGTPFLEPPRWPRARWATAVFRTCGSAAPGRSTPPPARPADEADAHRCLWLAAAARRGRRECSRTGGTFAGAHFCATRRRLDAREPPGEHAANFAHARRERAATYLYYEDVA